MPDSNHPVIDAAERFRAAALARDRQTATQLAQSYARIWRKFGDEIAILEGRPLVTGTDAARLRALRSLQRQVADEVSRWGVYADQEISAACLREIGFGLTDSRGLVQAYFSNPRAQAAIGARFDMLAPEQVETMLGFLADDSPLHQNLVNNLGPELAKRMGDTLEEGIALGYNPRKMAAIAQQEFGVGLQWALVTSRTAALWSYREASRANYMANADVIAGWVWWATLGSPRTCMSCVSQHGGRHDVDEVMAEHFSGRCTQIPIVPLAKKLGLSTPVIEDGEDWFRRQPASLQKALMGPAKWAAWTDDAITFADLSHVHNDPTYGDMLTESSLVSILGDGAKAYYVHK